MNRWWNRVAIAVALLCVPVRTWSAERPNILFCFADDWGRYASAYGRIDDRPSPSHVVKTPNIDRVAGEGVLFRHAFVTAPSCTPCRSSLLSGQYFFRTGRGAILSGAQWDPDIPSFPLMLRDAGYHIGETYKVWSPGTPNDGPFGAGKYAFEKAGGRVNQFSQNVTAMVAKGKTLDDAKAELLGEVSANFEAFLAQRGENQPFCYWFGPTNVHRLWTKGSGKAIWGIEPDDLKGKLPKFLPDVPEVREDFADYLGEAQAFDAAVGVILRQLEAAGEADNTLVVISGDHGAPGFPYGKCNLYDFGTGVALIARWPGQGAGRAGGRVVDDFVNLVDLAPTFLEIGQVPIPPVMTGKSLVPLLKSDREGLIDPERTWVITGRERHVGNAREDNLPYPQRALRTDKYLYIRNFQPERWPMGSPLAVTDSDAPDQNALEYNTRVAFPDMDASPTKAWLVAHRNDPAWTRHYDWAFAKRPFEELYDVAADPDQIVNVASDPRYSEIKGRLSEQLMRSLAEAADPRVLGDGSTFDKPPYSLPESPAPRAKAPRRKSPNVVFFLADDLGYADVGCFGQKRIRTPHIDRLATEGLRLTQHYSGNAVCAPSRCVLMTGYHPGHAHVRDNRSVKPEGQHPLPPDAVTLAKRLRDVGYATGAFGKWGLGGPGSTGDPLKQGFDRFFGYNCQAVAHNYYPTYLWNNDQKKVLNNRDFAAHQKLPVDADPTLPESYSAYVGNDYAPDLITDEAVEFIKTHRDRPFFAYLPSTIPHLALQVPEDGLAEYAGRFEEEPYPGGRGYLPHRTPRAAYAAMVSRLDRHVGRILDLLDELGLAESTIVVFSSDNGPLYDRLGGTDADFFESAAHWRGRKGSLYEGGVRVPTIVRWPGRVAAGTRSDRISGFEDWFPTLLEAVDATGSIPADLDGISLLPTLLGQPQEPRPYLYREFPAYGGQQTIRVGDWKAVRQKLRPPRAMEPNLSVELYNLATDPSESTDVAAMHPEKVAELSALMRAQHRNSADFPLSVLDEGR